LWIEFKAKKNKLTAEQKEWESFLKSENHEVHVVYDWVEAAKITIAYLDLDISLD
jgi:hypothetical protein